MSVAAFPGTLLNPDIPRLRSLYQLLVSITTASSLADVYEAAISSLLDTTFADGAAILLFDDDGVIRFKAARGISSAYQAAVTGHCPWKRGELNAAPIGVKDVAKEPDLSSYREVFAREQIRALAFIPLALDAGVFGKFMLYYREPHECTTEELEIAQAIAGHVAMAAARRMAEAENARTTRRLQAILDNCPAIIFLKDADGRYSFVNDKYSQLFGPREQILNRSDAEIFGPVLGEAFRANDRAVLEARKPMTFEETAPHPDGIHNYVSVKFPVEAAGGASAGICGIATDITDRKRLEDQLMLLLAASGTLLATPKSADVLASAVSMAQHAIAADGYAVWREGADEKTWVLASCSGVSDEFVRGGNITAAGVRLPTSPLVIPDVTKEPLLEQRQEALRREGVRSMLLVPLRMKNRPAGTIVFYWRSEHRFAQWESRLAAIIGNLSAAALSTAELYEEQLRLRAQAEASERHAAFLAQTGLLLASSLDYEQTLASVAKLAVPTFADWAAVDLLDEKGAVQRVAVAHSDPEKIGFAYEFSRRYPPTESDPSRVVLRTRQTLMTDLSDDMIERGAHDAEHAAAIRRLGIRSFIVTPMVYDDRSLGTITFATAESERSYGPADRKTAEELARRAAIAVEHARVHRDALSNEERLRAIVETTPECVKVVAADGTLLHMNPSGLGMIGARSAEEVVGRNVYDLIAPEFRDSFRAFNEAVCGGLKGSLEFEIVGLTGQRRHMETHAAPLGQTNGTTVHLAVARDVTQRRERERAALLLSAIVDSSDDAIISKDLNSVITSWNKGAELIFGYSAAEAVGRPITILIPPDRMNEEAGILDRLRRGERTQHFETVRQRKDGTLLHVSLTISPIKDALGRVVGASHIARNIDDRKRTEAELLASEARFRQLADSMPQIVWTGSPDGLVDYYNERWYQFAGTQTGVAGWQALIHPDDEERCQDAWLSSLRTGEPYNVECRLWNHQASRWGWFLVRALAARDQHGEIAKWFGCIIDIDAQKRVEEDLRRANEDLEQFAFSASHDLQEPLRTVNIYSDLMARTYGPLLDEQGHEFLKFVRNGAARMQTLLHDLLTYTQLTRFEMPEERADAGEALKTTLGSMEALIAQTGARVTNDPLPSPRVHGTHLQQLFQNLISNAIKYRSPDRVPAIHITAERRNGNWIFAVSDNGIGIDPQYKERIFGIFKRLHTNEEYSGTGIGLAICQRIVDRYHGRIWVESEPGRGSTFRFTLPV